MAQGTAAEKVLALPELLEHILVQLANITSAEAARSPWEVQLEPARTLSLVRGVDRTFRDAVNSSVKLERCIAGGPGRCPAEKITLSLRWLMEDQLQLSSHYHTQDPDDIRCYELRPHHEADELRKSRVTLLSKSTKGLWRKTKAVPHPWTLAFDVEPADAGVGPYSERVEFDAKATLGIIFDVFAEVVRRTPEQHEKGYKVCWDRVAKCYG